MDHCNHTQKKPVGSQNIRRGLSLCGITYSYWCPVCGALIQKRSWDTDRDQEIYGNKDPNVEDIVITKPNRLGK